MYDDNVMYCELRTGVSSIIDEGGSLIESVKLTQLLIEINNNFTKSHPGFLGFKVIIAVARSSANSKFESKLQQFISLKYMI